jgi:NTE family protein
LATEKKSFGLALSGGSLRGAAHFGVLQVLTENGIYPDYIAGTSIGAFIAALYGSNHEIFSARKLTDESYIKYYKLADWNFNAISLLCLGLKFPFLTRMIKYLPKGLIKGNNIERILKAIFDDKGFDDCRIPVYITAVDINTGELIVFTSSKHRLRGMGKGTVVYTDVSLAEAVRASISIPGIFVPKMLKNRVLIDGGVKNNVPVDILSNQGVELIAAVDLGFSTQKSNIDSIIEIILQTFDIMGQELSDLRTSLYADIVIDPGIKEMKLIDFHKIPECIKKGRESAQEALPDLIRMLG